MTSQPRSSRLAKVARLTECLLGAAPDEVAVAVAYLSGELPQGTVGVGWAALKDLPSASSDATLELLEVDAAITRVQSISGPGSQAARRAELEALFARATEPEQRLLAGLFLGELRQGALEGVMTEAVATGVWPTCGRRAPGGDARRRLSRRSPRPRSGTAPTVSRASG